MGVPAGLDQAIHPGPLHPLEALRDGLKQPDRADRRLIDAGVFGEPAEAERDQSPLDEPHIIRRVAAAAPDAALKGEGQSGGGRGRCGQRVPSRLATRTTPLFADPPGEVSGAVPHRPSTAHAT